MTHRPWQCPYSATCSSRSNSRRKNRSLMLRRWPRPRGVQAGTTPQPRQRPRRKRPTLIYACDDSFPFSFQPENRSAGNSSSSAHGTEASLSLDQLRQRVRQIARMSYAHDVYPGASPRGKNTPSTAFGATGPDSVRSSGTIRGLSGCRQGRVHTDSVSTVCRTINFAFFGENATSADCSPGLPVWNSCRACDDDNGWLA